MKLKTWWLSNVVWLIIFGILSFIIMTRKVDGSGLIQTPKIRLVSLIVLIIFFSFIFLIQLIILLVIKRK